MKLSHRLSLVVAITLMASTSLSAQVPIPNRQAPRRWIQRKQEAELSRDNLRADLAVMQYKSDSHWPWERESTVGDAIDAAHKTLHKGLEVGNGEHSIAYEKRIKELELISTQKLGQGTGTQREIEQVREARLDSLLKRLLNDAVDPAGR